MMKLSDIFPLGITYSTLFYFPFYTHLLWNGDKKEEKEEEKEDDEEEENKEEEEKSSEWAKNTSCICFREF